MYATALGENCKFCGASVWTSCCSNRECLVAMFCEFEVEDNWIASMRSGMKKYPRQTNDAAWTRVMTAYYVGTGNAYQGKLFPRWLSHISDTSKPMRWWALHAVTASNCHTCNKNTIAQWIFYLLTSFHFVQRNFTESEYPWISSHRWPWINVVWNENVMDWKSLWTRYRVHSCHENCLIAEARNLSQVALEEEIMLRL